MSDRLPIDLKPNFSAAFVSGYGAHYQACAEISCRRIAFFTVKIATATGVLQVPVCERHWRICRKEA